jgi:hypothetical protein
MNTYSVNLFIRLSVVLIMKHLKIPVQIQAALTTQLQDIEK